MCRKMLNNFYDIWTRMKNISRVWGNLSIRLLTTTKTRKPSIVSSTKMCSKLPVIPMNMKCSHWNTQGQIRNREVYVPRPFSFSPYGNLQFYSQISIGCNIKSRTFVRDFLCAVLSLRPTSCVYEVPIEMKKLPSSITFAVMVM